MDKILKEKITEIIEKVKADPSLMQKLLSNPTGVVKELSGIDLPEEQVKAVTNAIQSGTLDLSGVDLSDGIDMKDVSNVAGKLGGLFGGK